MRFIRRTLILTSIILYANAAYGWTTPAGVLTRWIALTPPTAGRPTTSAPASTTCYCYPGCGRHNECCSNCKADPFITTPPVRSRCHCRPWCYRYNECCSYCQNWYTTQPAILTTTTAPVRTRCHCRSSCYRYNECCSYCPSWYTTPSVSYNEYQGWYTTPSDSTHSTKVVFVDSAHKFTSPNFPGAYPNNLAARWHFSTFEGFRLLLKFQVLVTEACCDSVKVGNGNSTDRQLVFSWGGGPAESEVRFLSSGNTLWITFDTDSSVTETGFEASVEVVNINSSALDCDGFHCVSEGVCIPYSRVCYLTKCASAPEHTCFDAYSWTSPASVSTRIRLVGGLSVHEGRVEVFHKGEWGTVCDDAWNDTDASVVCRQLGYSDGGAALSSATFGQGSGPIWLDDVTCTGSEERLQDCENIGWGPHNCRHSEDAGVRCYLRDSTTIRLFGGSSANEGRIEVFHNGQWGTVCDDNWDEIDAAVVCRQLGYNGGAIAFSEAYFDFFVHEATIWLDDVNCTGNENALQECQSNGWGSHDCSHQEDAGVRCLVNACYCYPGCDWYNECCSYCKADSPTTTPPARSSWYTTPSDSTHSTKVVFVDSTYTFTSPNFPGAYPNNLTARWHFSTFEGFRLLLKFQVLVTEACCDSVKVGNGNSTDRQLVFSWGGGPPESEVRFLSSGNTLWMTFKTDFSVTATGFEASVEVVNISSSALDCDGFHCVSEGVCIPYDRVCYLTKCTSAPTNLCIGWNTEEAGWYTEEPGSIWATEDPLDEIILHCEPTSFQVDLPVQILPIDMQPSDFFLSGDPFDPSCRGFRNGDHYFSLNSSLTKCGTVITETETFISYRNLVAYTRNTSRVVEHYIDELPVQCDYDRSKQLQSHFVIDESSQRIKRAKGSFLYDFSMYTDMSFDVRYYSYPVETTSDRYLYFRAELLQSPDNLRIHLRSCRATPSQNFDDAVVFEFIHDGCVIDDANVRVLTPSSPVQADFMIQSFRFRPDLSNYTSQVWIHCEVVVCDVNDQSSECLHDCERSRRRRSVAESSKEATRLIQGPIFFTDTEDLDQKSGSFLLMEEREEFIIFTVALTIVCLVMFLTLVVVGWALFKIMRRVKRMEYRPPQNERYSTL